MLLDALIKTRGLTPAALAEELVVPVPAIDGFLAGTERIPLERQLCLALFATQYPELARKARNLRAQVLANIEFEQGFGSSVGVVRRLSWKRDRQGRQRAFRPV
jgi:hypothetical protein